MELTINTVQVFRDFGLTQALIRRQRDVKETANTVFFLMVVWGSLLFFLLFILAPWVALFFDDLRAEAPVRVIAATLLFSSLGAVPAALLEKELAFKEKSLPEILSAAVYSGVVIVLVALKLGVWSIVWGRIIQTALTTILIWRAAHWRIEFRFNGQIAKEVLKYGQHILIASILGIAFLYVDNIFVGSLLGSTALGFYTFGFTLANLPAQSITPIINKVTFPTYAKIQENLAALATIYLRSLKLTSVLSFPATLGLAVLSASFLRVLYGDKWLDSIVLVQILSFYGLFRSVGALTSNVFYVIGKQYIVPRVLLIIFAIVVMLLWPATLWFGTVGTSLVMTGIMILGVIFWLALVNYYLAIPVRRFVQNLLPQTLASVIMTGYLLLLTGWLKEGLSTLFLLITTGAGIYLVGILLIDRGQIYSDVSDIIAILRKG
jgi:O-antigen/teichoic acid export membrane protein